MATIGNWEVRSESHGLRVFLAAEGESEGARSNGCTDSTNLRFMNNEIHQEYMVYNAVEKLAPSPIMAAINGSARVDLVEARVAVEVHASLSLKSTITEVCS